MLVALTILCGVFCASLIVAEWRGLRVLRFASKLIASAAFVAIGTVAFRVEDVGLSRESQFADWIFAGLVLGAIGDLALLGRSKRWFMAGLVAFLLGHLAYVSAVTFVEYPSGWLGHAGVYGALPVIVGTIALILLWPKLGALKLPVVFYVITIVTMVIAAIAVARGTAIPTPQRIRFVVGAALFFVSDLSVARERFIARTLPNKLWGLPAYYAGQLLIAWSVVDL